MKKILVTGGAGFVGRHLCRYWLDQGAEVHCVDNIVPLTGGVDPDQQWPLYDPRNYANFHFYKEDCRSWFKAHHDNDFDYAFHLAAMVGGRQMIEDHPLAVADDLSIDAEYWQWAKLTQPRKTVCFSSSAAYPIKFQRADHYMLLKEDMIDFADDIGMPDMSYGWAKLTHEYLARIAFQKHGLKSVTYRPFSGYGEDQDTAYPFPSVCRRILAHQGAKTVTVWGSGDQMRDFIHIEDCIQGIIHTMDQIENGDAVNLSTGILTSFKQFAATAAAQVGYTPEIIGTSNTPEGVFARGGDTGKQLALGFSAKISFADGIARGLRYAETNMSKNIAA